MSPQAREKLLVLILPALGAVLVYGGFLNQDGVLAEARKQLAAARLAALHPEDVQLAEIELTQLGADMAGSKTAKAELDRRWCNLTAACNPPSTARNQALQRITGLLWKNGLFSVEESPLESGGHVPASLQDTLRLVAGGQQSVGQEQLWRIRFFGRYPDVMHTLDVLSREASPIIPVGITMSEASLDTDLRSWTLLLWM